MKDAISAEPYHPKIEWMTSKRQMAIEGAIREAYRGLCSRKGRMKLET